MLYNILLLFLCMPMVHFLSSLPPNRTKENKEESKLSFRTFFRKQLISTKDLQIQQTRYFAFSDIPKDLISAFQGKGEIETYYEPYWKDGAWVFNRSEATGRPQAFNLIEGNSAHDECIRICPKFVEDYGLVCTAKYNYTTAEYDYRAFEDYCQMESENCYFAKKVWFPVKKGNCTGRMTTQPFDHIFLVTRAAIHENVRNDSHRR